MNNPLIFYAHNGQLQLQSQTDGHGRWRGGLEIGIAPGGGRFRGRSLLPNCPRMFLLFSCYLHEIAPGVIQLAVIEGVKVQIVSLCVCVGHDYKP